jgi:SNF2 family DNA or RNA helicase
MLKRSQLHGYQVEATDFILEKKRCALWLGMGFGKTVSTLTAITDLFDSLSITKVLIVAPLRVANSVWHTEISNWVHLNHLTYSICTGGVKQRTEALNKEADIYIINRENVKWLVDNGYAKNFDMVVIDESDSFKNSSSQRFKAMKKISPYANYFVELTGTPSPNGYLDLWSQMYLIDGGNRLGRTNTAYKDRFFSSDYMGYSWELKKGSENKIKKLLKDKVYSAEQVIKTKRIDIPRFETLPPKLEKQYKELEKNFLVELEKEQLEVMNAVALSNKLMQFSNGAVYNEEGETINIHDIKIEMLKEILEPLNEPVLVAYNYKSDLAKLQKHFPHGRVLDKNAETIEEWNNKKIPLLFAHPASAGHGLNLQHGGSIMVWFGLTFNLAYYQQFIARLDRQGQPETVRNILLIIKNTIDEKVIQAIENKAKTQKDLIEYIKNCI